MERNTIMGEIVFQLIILDHNFEYDYNDLGNLIGLAVSKYTTNAEAKEDFIAGFNHGFSINDGTHG